MDHKCDFNFFGSFVLANTESIESSTHRSIDFVLTAFSVVLPLMACFAALVLMVILIILGAQVVMHLIDEAEARLGIQIKALLKRLRRWLHKKKWVGQRKQPTLRLKRYRKRLGTLNDMLREPGDKQDDAVDPPPAGYRWPRSSSNY